MLLERGLDGRNASPRLEQYGEAQGAARSGRASEADAVRGMAGSYGRSLKTTFVPKFLSMNILMAGMVPVAALFARYFDADRPRSSGSRDGAKRRVTRTARRPA